VDALRKKERQGETEVTIKIDGFLSFTPRWMLMYFFAGFFWISPCVWPNSGYSPCLFLTLRISLMYSIVWHGMFEINYILCLRLPKSPGYQSMAQLCKSRNQDGLGCHVKKPRKSAVIASPTKSNSRADGLSPP
jgi:hypothetical protein